MKRRTVAAAGVVLLAFFLAPPTVSARDFEVKMATLSPEGSPWDNIFRKMGQEWTQGSDGRVSLLIYAGGQVGDEADILRKMRFNQYHGAMLTVRALADIDESFKVFQIPLFFQSYRELEHVMADLGPLLKERLKKKGFIHLGWGYAGWVHVFTTKPVETVSDLKALKLWTSAGDDEAVQSWKRSGFHPVPLAATDILTGLQTGMVEALATPPLAAMQLQYYRKTPYMMDLGLAPLIGAILITERAWNRIDEGDRAKMLEASGRAQAKLIETIPKLDETAIKLMASQGLNVVEVRNGEHAGEWLKEAEAFATRSRDRSVPADIFDLARKSRDAFRSQQDPGTESGGDAP